LKVDRRNPLHWLLLLLSAVWVMLAICLRPILHGSMRKGRVLLYGHKLGGNLLAIQRHLRSYDAELQVSFLTMDPAYHRELVARGEGSVLSASPASLPWLVGADALISDHGLHALQPLVGLSDIKFFDVWHAIPFKGFDADDFRVLHRYKEAWVASPLLAGLYVDKYGFDPDKVVVTGYARSDRLVKEKNIATGALRQRMGLPADAGKVVLFAPTWKQDSNERSLFPFDMEADAFCNALSDIACQLGATVILRTHINSGRDSIDASRFRRLVSLPYADYPDTEEILLVTDVLVCDWSSIAFDFLLLDRPTVFLDVPAPFKKGFTLGPEYRFGEVVPDLGAMLHAIELAVLAPSDYMARHATVVRNTRHEVYGRFADGNATARCVGRLKTALGLEGRRYHALRTRKQEGRGFQRH